MNDREEVEHLIRTHGGVLKRQRKHKVYEFPDGRCFVLAKTPGDTARAERNNLADLRRFLGITKEIHKSAERKSRPTRRARREKPRYTAPLSPIPQIDYKRKLAGLLKALPFRPRPACLPVHLERLPRTPLFAILFHLFPF